MTFPPRQIGKSLTRRSGNQSNTFLAGQLFVSGALARDAYQASRKQPDYGNLDQVQKEVEDD